MLVIYASGEIENSAVVFTTVSLLAFVGGFAVLIEGLLPLFGVLLVFWILLTVIVCGMSERDGYTVIVVTIFSVLSYGVDWKNISLLLFPTLVVIYSLPAACDMMIFFAFDLALFLW